MSDWTAPLRGRPLTEKPWEGLPAQKKPWQFRVTAAIPVIDGSDYLPLCVELLRLQTEPVFIMLIDTGSAPVQFERIAEMRAPHLEVHRIQLHGVRHPSDFPAMAMDLAFTLCRSEWLFATHQDVFLRRQDLLADLVARSRSENIAVLGYEITPRQHDDWKGMISHTASMYHMPAMDRAGVAWSLRKLANLCGLEDHAPDPARPNWPDTEVLSNYFFRHHQLKTEIIGTEQNYRRTLDDNIDHPRSIPSAALYSADYLAAAQSALNAAVQEARDRISLWQNNPVCRQRA
jgi:hypothetical protein